MTDLDVSRRAVLASLLGGQIRLKGPIVFVLSENHLGARNALH